MADELLDLRTKLTPESHQVLTAMREGVSETPDSEAA